MQALGLAKYYYKSGRFKEAAKLFLEAYDIDPKVEFLFNAARAEQRAVLLKQAKVHFQACIASKTAPKTVVERARIHIKEIENIEAALAQARSEGSQPAASLTTTTSVRKDELVGVTNIKEHAGPAATTGPAKAASPASSSAPIEATATGKTSWKTSAGWSAIGSGAVLGLVGAWLLAEGRSIGQELNNKTLHNDDEPRDKNGKVQHISFEEYDQEMRSAEEWVHGGVAAMSVGVVALGLGGWWLWTAPSQISLAPTPGGGRVSVNWRF